LSVIAGLTVSAQRHRIGLYFAIHEQNVKTRKSRRSSVMCNDRLAAHCSV
jgi:hypothetical protein